MNKKITLSIVLIAIIALALTTWFVHNQISELQNQISELQAQNSELQHQINELQDQNRGLQDQNDELQTQLDLLQKWLDYEPEVRITEFSSRSGWWNPVGVTVALDFTIKISNTGISDIMGLTIEIKRLNVDEDPYAITRTVGILHARNTTEIQDSIFIGLDNYAEFHNCSFVATLKLGDVVLHVLHYLPRALWAQ